MNILHVSAGIQETCGVSCFVMETARAQMMLGHCVCVVTTMTCGYPVGDVDVRLMEDPTQIEFKPDVVHLHALWSPYVHKMAVWCRRRGIPYVISPHGALTRWALRYHWWKKLPAMVLYQYRDLRKAAAFHVTAEAEQLDIRRLGLKQTIVTAPLGVHLPDIHVDGNVKTVLFLGRIHPVKNLDALLKAWAGIPCGQRRGWRIVIAGPDDVGHQQELKELASALNLSVSDFSQDLQYGKKQIHGGGEVPADVYREKLATSRAEVVFTGAVYSGAKEYLYQCAKYFVLPSFSENFGMVVLEALAAGTPVLTTTGTPWECLKGAGCGLWVAPEVNAIKTALETFLGMPDVDYRAMSEKARAFVKENYLWKSSAEKLLVLYQKIVGR